jgi:peptidoglycan/LPS O-acetylase OafA/YrhL
LKTPAIHPGITYRADIDGLRALAVVPVLFFHAGFPAFGGGYVGVDIFFVISGYLITEVLLRDWRVGEFSIARFYERRARRILPALFTVMAFSSVLAIAIMVPPDLKQFAASVLAAATFWSNFIFWAQDGYFTAASHYKPLLHTWSLAVEEQFYILYPLVLWLILKSRQPRLIYLILLLVGFGASIWAASIHQNSAFYLSPFRAWELLLGGALVVIDFPRIKSPALAELTALVALAAIIFAVVTFNTSTQIPGAPALLPCGGAALLMHIGKSKRTVVAKVLELRPFVAAGLISYSLYLWHWPLLAFARLYLLRPLTVYETLAVLAASGMLALVSWSLIEIPFRKKTVSRKTRRYFALAASVVFISVVVATYATDGLPQRFTSRVDYLASFENKSDIRDAFSRLGVSQCFGFEHEGDLVSQVDKCLAPSAKHPSIAIWGDSHAAMYFSGLMESVEFRKQNVSVAALASCAPVAGIVKPVQCPEFYSAVGHSLAQTKPDVVIIAGYWDSLGLPISVLAARLHTTINKLLLQGAQVILVGPGVEFDESLPVILARDASRGRYGENHTRAGIVSADDYLAKEFERTKGITYISVVRAMCPGGACITTVEGTPISSDESHLTREGGKFVSAKVIAPAIYAALSKYR